MILSDQQACPKCSRVRHITEFYPSSQFKPGHYCIECKKQANRASYRAADQGVFQTQVARRAKYGVSVRSLNRMFAAQNGCCACCKEASLVSSNHRWVQPDRDVEGKVMALLCLPCHRFMQTLARNEVQDIKPILAYWRARPLRRVIGPAEARRLRYKRGQGIVAAMMKEQGL